MVRVGQAGRRSRQIAVAAWPGLRRARRWGLRRLRAHCAAAAKGAPWILRRMGESADGACWCTVSLASPGGAKTFAARVLQRDRSLVWVLGMAMSILCHLISCGGAPPEGYSRTRAASYLPARDIPVLQVNMVCNAIGLPHRRQRRTAVAEKEAERTEWPGAGEDAAWLPGSRQSVARPLGCLWLQKARHDCPSGWKQVWPAVVTGDPA